MQGGRSQQTMPEDRTGWRQIDAGPHLEVLFHPNRRPGGREPDEIVRPSIVVAVAGKREQALRFDPFSMGRPLSHPAGPGRTNPTARRGGTEPARRHHGIL